MVFILIDSFTEVSCIGRSLGMLAAEKIKDELPMWISPADVGAIIQAACLAHDIGNPLWSCR